MGSLQPGQTGCLRAGLYEQDVAIERGGSAGSPVTLSSYPGERATLRGRLRVKDSANFVTIEGLDLDGRHPADTLPSPSVYGNDVVFRDNDVTNYHTGICFLLGFERLRPRGAGHDRAQPDPRLRCAAGPEPPPRDLHRARGQHPGARQLDLRQRGSRGADVPRFPERLHRAQRDRRQRAGRELRTRVRAQRGRAQRGLQLGAALEHRGLGAERRGERRTAELRLDDAHRLVRP